MPGPYASIIPPVAVTLLLYAVVGRRTGDVTPRIAAGLEAIVAACAATVAYVNQDWPWDAINSVATLILIARWATYPTKREREQQQ